MLCTHTYADTHTKLYTHTGIALDFSQHFVVETVNKIHSDIMSCVCVCVHETFNFEFCKSYTTYTL